MKVGDLLRQLSRMAGTSRAIVKWKHPDRPQTITVPGHPSDEFHPKTLQSILKQAGYKS